MNTKYQFGVRFRADASEIEGSGSLLAPCEAVTTHVTVMVRQVVARISREHPQAVFDGVIYYGSHDSS
jgi:hypothetical protein